jgi:hypothetical protein
MSEVTHILSAIEESDSHAAKKLLPLVTAVLPVVIERDADAYRSTVCAEHRVGQFCINHSFFGHRSLGIVHSVLSGCGFLANVWG